MATFVSIVQSFGLLVARIVLGAILLMHGWTRWQTEGVQKQVDYLAQFSAPYPQVAVWAAIIFEMVGGVFLIVGALTPLIGAGILVQQVLTIAYTNWFQAVEVVQGGAYNDRFEYNVALGLLGLFFLVFGGGAAAIDRLFRRKSTVEDFGDDEAAVTTRTQPAVRV